LHENCAAVPNPGKFVAQQGMLFMTSKWEDDGRRAVMQEFAEDAHAAGNHFFYVRIPGNIQPLERGERFEDPLDAALESDGIGSVTGGGSQLGDDKTVAFCGLDVVVTNRDRGIEIIRRVLTAAQCPKDAVIEEYLPEYAEFLVWMS
jgi:hypothetical protein